MKEKMKQSKRNKKIIGWSIFALVNILIILITLLARTAFPFEGIEAWSQAAWASSGQFLLEEIYLNSFFRQPALILGSLTLTGYMLIGRGWKDSILGALKVMIGYLLLAIGSSALVGMAKPIFQIIGSLGKNVVPLDPYFSLASSNSFFGVDSVTGTGQFGTNSYVSLISFVLILGFAINIIFVALKKFTNTNSLMITGHVMLQQSAVVTTIFYVILFGSFPLLDGKAISAGSQIGLVIMAGLFLGIYWSVASTATLKPTNAITGGAGFAIGHQQMLGAITAYKIGKWFGKKEHSIESKKMPSYLKIFEDNIFTQSIIIMLLFFVLIMIIMLARPELLTWGKSNWLQFNADEDFLESIGLKNVNIGAWNNTFGTAANIPLNIFGGSLKIVASLIAIMTGVRMFITELQQSFHGISEKLIPGAIVAVDVAAIYGFSINAVTFGFVSGVIGQFLGVGIVIGLSFIPNFPIVITIPLFITLFFNSGSLGVYANASGGWKATLFVPAIIGLFEIIIISFALAALKNASALDGGLKNPAAGGYIGMSDWNIFFGLITWFSSYHYVVAWILVPLSMIAMIFMGMIVDSGMQTKKTWLQKLLKLNPTLVS